MELVVVSLGVLVALAADSWWRGQQDVDRALGYMRALQADMSQARVQLDTGLERTDDQLERTETMLGWIRSDAPIPDGATCCGIAIGGDPDIPLGTLSALVQTGDVNLIESEELRALIVSRHAVLASQELRLGRFYDLVLDNLRDLLAAHEAVRHEQRILDVEVPVEIVRGNPAIISAYRVHLVTLTNRRVILQFMCEEVDSMLLALADALGGPEPETEPCREPA
jgi:hypothetical protein